LQISQIIANNGKDKKSHLILFVYWQWFQTKRSSLLKIAFLILKIPWQMSCPIRLVLIQLQPNIQSPRLSYLHYLHCVVGSVPVSGVQPFDCALVSVLEPYEGPLASGNYFSDIIDFLGLWAGPVTY
jgi:hypothetical protein